jgi:hypothetical protein
MSRQRIVLAAALVSLLALPANAATFTVGVEKDYSTIQACADVALPGDICEIYAGIYNETVTAARSGSAGSPIAFKAHPGDTAIVYGFVITNRTYITISGLEITNPLGNGVFAQTGAHHAIIENNTIHSPGGHCIRFGLGTSNDVTIRKNTMYGCGGVGISFISGNAAVSPGDRLLIENNEISSMVDQDMVYIGGNYVVIRNNYFHDYATTTGVHLDGIQHSGMPFSYVLIEGNVNRNCTDPMGNCHAFITRNQTAAPADTIIYRYNYAQNLDGPYYVMIGGSGDDVRNVRVYNNTSAGGVGTEKLWSASATGVGFTNAPNGVAKNNIVYNRTGSVFYSPWHGAAQSDGNLAYTSGYSGEWQNPYSVESTYANLRNLNPLFENYPTDASLGAGSPARAAGVALTAVATADTGSGATLLVQDARYFQPGWAGVNADWIRIGATTKARISSIDYTTNKITLASEIVRSPGDPVYLYRDSSGTVVLTESAPDVGAALPRPAAPTSLRIVR